MRPFDFHPATSVSEAVDLLGRYGEGTQLLAGGTSVMLLGRLGLVDPEHVVGLRDVDELRGIEVTPSGEVRLGALATLREVETSQQVRRQAPALAEAVHTVATIRIRHQATVGGNLAHADPAQDAPPMLMALGATVEAVGGHGRRSFPIEQLFAGFLETTLAPDEVLAAVVVPPQEDAAGYLKFLPRTKDDYATVSVAAALRCADGRCTALRVALGGVGATPLRAPSVEAALTGQRPDAGTVEDAAAQVRADIDPIGDARGSAAYKRDMAVVCVARLLRRLLATNEEPT